MEKNETNKAAQAAGTASGVLHTILKVIGTLLLILLTTGLLFLRQDQPLTGFGHFA